ncbi:MULTISPECIES: hypothetical protein [Streptomyces]|uniref:hypothetical protein n=1 Tax=Streptomyces TaxID=1883 RepID=UPI001F0BD35A|nr:MULTISPECIES: hypothetical protein [Streptomyces]
MTHGQAWEPGPGGAARRSTLAALALEQRAVIAADRRAFRHLAERSAAGTEMPAAEPESAAFFGLLAEGEALAQERLAAFAAAAGADEPRQAAYEPLADCQTYPAYVSWLALNGSPVDAVLALSANFATWGGYCATIAGALRRQRGAVLARVAGARPAVFGEHLTRRSGRARCEPAVVVSRPSSRCCARCTPRRCGRRAWRVRS